VSDELPTVAFFTDPASGPARKMDSIVAHLARTQRHTYRVVRIDVTQKPELAERLKVTNVPTLLMIKNKRVVGRLEGRVSAPRIQRMVEEHLSRGREEPSSLVRTPAGST
jgi:thioredoxin 1